LGTGVYELVAGIFALLGQVAELSGQMGFLIAFFGGSNLSLVFSAYSYIKMSKRKKYPFWLEGLAT